MKSFLHIDFGRQNPPRPAPMTLAALLVIFVPACGTRGELSEAAGSGSSTSEGSAATTGTGGASVSSSGTAGTGGASVSSSGMAGTGAAGAGGSGGSGCTSGGMGRGAHLWSKQFGDPLNQTGKSIAADSAGNVLVAGAFQGEVDFGGGPLVCDDPLDRKDIFLVKFDACGEHVLTRKFGDPENQDIVSVAVDGADNVFLAGGLRGSVDFGGGPLTSAGSSDVFVAKFDASGAHLWSERFGDPEQQDATSVAVDGAGNVYLAGSFRGTIDLGGEVLASAGGFDIFVAKLGAGGQFLWGKGFGGASEQLARGIAVDSAGNAVITGFFLDTVDFGGGPLTSGSSDPDIYVVKLDAAGNHLWSKGFGDSLVQVGTGVAVDGAGDVLLTGFFQDTTDFGGGGLASVNDSFDIYVAKLDAAGNHVWSEGFGGGGDESVNGIAIDATGNVLLTGGFHSTVDFGGGGLGPSDSLDGFVVKLAPSGEHLFSRSFGGSNTQIGAAIAADGEGNVLLTGYFRDTTDFGGGLLTSAGSADIFVAKLGP